MRKLCPVYGCAAIRLYFWLRRAIEPGSSNNDLIYLHISVWSNLVFNVNFFFEVTHWHDGSAIYGSTQFQSDLLRERKGGRMKTFSYQNRQLLPLDWNNKDCIGYSKGLRCFLSGETFFKNICLGFS